MKITPLVLHHDRKTSLAGLREAFDAEPASPPKITFRQYTDLDSEARELYDQAREDFLRLTLRVKTREQTVCARILEDLIRINPRLKNSRRGLMISAPMFSGKTELALLLARSVERRYAAQHPDYLRDGDAPVVWVEMTEHSTGKALLAQIVEFLAPTIVLPKQIATDRLRKLAVEALHRHGTKLLVIDEAHKLGGTEPSSVIKALQNESCATVVLVGINLDQAFKTGDGLQVSARCDFVTLDKIDPAVQEDFEQWIKWVATFDSFLPLCGHAHGLLTRNAGTLVHAADGKLAVLAMIVDRLVASILRDESRTSETVTRERLFGVLDTLRRTTLNTHNVTLDDLVDAA
ncbi:TniB family NTP-binding protein [Microbacterium algeriense]|uniref:TniB family NTP-binding protein n=1 Tax=Microbacterium algeriense TaxID=2615184 RepID=UPI0029A7FC20|nr:TniB family NTP-binding protein [Microbacterium algeriense]MDX2401170.1 TniB family NTP-binding protein [Microbacterium algeriense]